MAEGHVKIIPPSQTSGLYPSIEVENNTSETISTSSENQLSSFKVISFLTTVCNLIIYHLLYIYRDVMTAAAL